MSKKDEEERAKLRTTFRARRHYSPGLDCHHHFALRVKSAWGDTLYVCNLCGAAMWI